MRFLGSLRSTVSAGSPSETFFGADLAPAAIGALGETSAAATTGATGSVSNSAPKSPFLFAQP